jgi:hypothetical protein
MANYQPRLKRTEPLSEMNAATRPKSPTAALYEDVRRLLKKYRCKLKLHQVRAQFMGAIASPVDRVNPALEIQTIWSGQAPDFVSVDDANEFMQVLVTGLWNHVAGHFGTGKDFELTEHTPDLTEKALKAHAKLRFEELQSFLIGFFQGQDSIHLSHETGDCLDVLDDLIVMFGGIARLPKERRPVTAAELSGLLDQLNKLTEIAQHEVNQIIAISAHQRRGGDFEPPTVH